MNQKVDVIPFVLLLPVWATPFDSHEASQLQIWQGHRLDIRLETEEGAHELSPCLPNPCNDGHEESSAQNKGQIEPWILDNGMGLPWPQIFLDHSFIPPCVTDLDVLIHAATSNMNGNAI